MPFGSLTTAQEILVRLYLLGGPAYKREMIESGAATGLMSKEQQKLALAQAEVTKRSWTQNQAMFTARRFLFYSTLGMIGLGAEALRMGFRYESAMQTATVAMEPVLGGIRGTRAELGKLFSMAAVSPFQFKDLTTSFRSMYAAFHPLGLSAAFTNQTMQSLIDALSYMGKATPASLNRVSVALQHMAYLGRPIGQTMMQLARDGLPIYAALSKELGLTGDQIHSIATSGLTAQQVIAALNKYIETTPGFMHAAFRQANHTLVGSFTTFKDLLSQAIGGGKMETGIFGWLHRTLKGINAQLYPTAVAGKPIGLTQFVEAIDKRLTPRTHTILNFFILLESALNQVYNMFHLLWYIVGQVLSVFNLLPGGIKKNHDAARALGWILGSLIGLFLLTEGAVLAAKAAMLLFRGALFGVHAAILAVEAAQEGLAIWNIASSGVGLWKAWMDYSFAGSAAVRTNTGLLARLGRVAGEAGAWISLYLVDPAIAGFKRMYAYIMSDLIPMVWNFAKSLAVTAYEGVVSLATAIWTELIPAMWGLVGVEVEADLLNPLMWIPLAIIAVGTLLTVLFFKWKWFHNFVIGSISYIKKHWLDMLGAALMVFTFMLGPVAWLIGAGILLYNHWKPFRDLVDWIWKKLKDIWDWLKGPLGFIEKLATHLGFGSNQVAGVQQAPAWARGQLQHQIGTRAVTRQTVPAGSRSIIPGNQGVASVANFIKQGEGGGKDINVNLVVDRQVLATAVARANQDYAARR